MLALDWQPWSLVLKFRTVSDFRYEAAVQRHQARAGRHLVQGRFETIGGGRTMRQVLRTFANGSF